MKTMCIINRILIVLLAGVVGFVLPADEGGNIERSTHLISADMHFCSKELRRSSPAVFFDVCMKWFRFDFKEEKEFFLSVVSQPGVLDITIAGLNWAGNNKQKFALVYLWLTLSVAVSDPMVKIFEFEEGGNYSLIGLLRTRSFLKCYGWVAFNPIITPCSLADRSYDTLLALKDAPDHLRLHLSKLLEDQSRLDSAPERDGGFCIRCCQWKRGDHAHPGSIDYFKIIHHYRCLIDEMLLYLGVSTSSVDATVFSEAQLMSLIAQYHELAGQVDQRMAELVQVTGRAGGGGEAAASVTKVNGCCCAIL